MRPKTSVASAIVLCALLANVCSAQFCVHLQWPLWAYGDGTIVYFAYRSDGLCSENCESETPVYHIDDPEYLDELAHDCELGEGIQYASRTSTPGGLYVKLTEADRNALNQPLLDQPVKENHEFFSTWNSATTPGSMKKGGSLRGKTKCASSNHLLIDPSTGEEIKVRIHKISINSEGCWPKTFYVAHERGGAPGQSVLRASRIVRQEGSRNGYRFQLEGAADSPYPGASWFLLIRVGDLEA